MEKENGQMGDGAGRDCALLTKNTPKASWLLALSLCSERPFLTACTDQVKLRKHNIKKKEEKT